MPRRYWGGKRDQSNPRRQYYPRDRLCTNDGRRPEGLIRTRPPSSRPNAPYLNFGRIRCDDTSTAIADPAQPDWPPENPERSNSPIRAANDTTAGRHANDPCQPARDRTLFVGVHLSVGHCPNHGPRRYHRIHAFLAEAVWPGKCELLPVLWCSGILVGGYGRTTEGRCVAHGGSSVAAQGSGMVQCDGKSHRARRRSPRQAKIRYGETPLHRAAHP